MLEFQVRCNAHYPVKRSVIILFSCLLYVAGLIAQEQKMIYEEYNTSSWGYKAGLLLPAVHAGSSDAPVYKGDSVAYDVNYHPGVKPGLTFGLFYETRLAKLFYLQMEVNYQWYQYRLDYIKNTKDEYNSVYDANYNLRSSSLFVPLLPKFRFGNRYKMYLMAGPYINVPLSSHILGEIVIEKEEAAGKVTSTVVRDESINVKPEKLEYGLIGGVGFKVPLRMDDLIVELRYGGSLNDVLKDPNLKEQTFSLHLGIIKALK